MINGGRHLLLMLSFKMKQEFFDYLGKADSLAGYQKSYKLVFYKVFFEKVSNLGTVSVADLVNSFKYFYLERKQAGLISDINVDATIANVEDSSFESIYKLILRNPFDAITKQGFIKLEKIGNEEYFKLNEQLLNELSQQDIDCILKLVTQKLELYYSSIDKDNVEINAFINKIFNEYIEAKQQAFAGNPMGNYFRNSIPEVLYKTGIVDEDKYLITGSVGKGNWATIPWICIFDKSITTSATKGVYIVYLLSKDGNTLYLTFNQGCTEIRKKHNRNETIEIMRNNAAKIVSMVDNRGFTSDENINLGAESADIGVMYQKGTIFYKAYHKGNIPEEAELRDDLSKMMAIYKEYVEKISEDSNVETELTVTGGEKSLSIAEIINNIKNYIAAKGFNYNDGLIENFYLTLKAKPFVILAGTSGTGKTRLVKLFAEAVGATEVNGRYKMVAVRPHWSDSSDLFGHVDLNGRFIPGAIIDFIKQAEIDSKNPYFLCLDEMNLARVEYYLSDILSVIETRDFIDGKIVSAPLVSEFYYGADQNAAGKYGVVRLPENLYLIGTVNMDETTFPFSRKVLDRANTIEFSYVDLMPVINVDNESYSALNLDNSFLKTEYLLLNECFDSFDDIQLYCAELQSINKILQQANAHIGYRVRDELIFYLVNNKKYGLLAENEAFDNGLMQKILPRIQGSSAAVKSMLSDLFKHCAGDFSGYSEQSDNLSNRMHAVLKESGRSIKYRKSAEKIELMTRRLEEDGFTSYWL